MKTKKLSIIWGLHTIFCLILVAYSGDNWYLYSISTLISCLFTLMYLSPNNLAYYICIFIILQFSFKPFILTLDSTYGTPYMDSTVITLKSYWDEVLSFQSISFGFFLLMYSIFRDKNVGNINKKDSLIKDLPPLKYIYIIYIFIWIFRLLMHYFNIENSIILRIANYTPILISSLIVYIIVSNKLKSFSTIISVLLFLMLELTWSILIEAKLPLMLSALSVFYAISFLEIKIKKRYLIVSIIAILTFIGIIQIIRNPSVYGEMNVIQAGLVNLIGRSDNFNTAVRIFYYTPNIIPYWGMDMLKVLAQTTILPVPFPGKADIYVGSVVSNLYYGYTEGTVFKGLGLATSWYVTFGSIYGTLVMGIFGVILAKLENILTTKSNWLKFLIQISFIVAFANIEQSYFDIINTFMKNVILSICFYISFKIIFSKRE